MSERIDIGFLGLGEMGRRMAARCADAGHDLRGWNRTRRALDGVPSATLKEAAGCAVVVEMLSDDAASRAVWLEGDAPAIDALRPGALVLLASTLSPDWVDTLVPRLEQKGVAVVHAPVLGTLPQAEAGALVSLPAGVSDPRSAPVLAAWGASRPVEGRPSAAAYAKLAVNMLLATQVAGLGESLAILANAGLTRRDAAALLEGLPLVSPALASVLNAAASEAHPTFFPLRLVAKDTDYAIAASGGGAEVLRGTRAMIERALNAGGGDRHISALVEYA